MTESTAEKMTPELIKRVATLKLIQDKLRLSDADFLRGCESSVTTWSRLKSGTYAGNVTKQVGIISRHVKTLEKDRSAAASKPQTRFHKTSDFADLELALDEAKANASAGLEDKLVVYVAQSGWGKTTNAKQLIEQRPGALFTARPDWRRSYKYALQTIANGLSIREHGTAFNLEGAIIDHLADNPQTLYFQELGPFTISARLIEFFKALLNETGSVIVLFVVPEFYSVVFSQCGETAKQLRRRTVATIKASTISAGLVGKFLADHFTPPSHDTEAGKAFTEAAKLIAKAANQSTGLHLVANVCRMLAAELKPNGNTITADDAAKKIAAYTAAKDPA